MNPLTRRLARLESAGGSDLLIVSQYVGMAKDEALQLRFGPEGPPLGANLVFIVNALPLQGVECDWAEQRGTPAMNRSEAEEYKSTNA